MGSTLGKILGVVFVVALIGTGIGLGIVFGIPGARDLNEDDFVTTKTPTTLSPTIAATGSPTRLPTHFPTRIPSNSPSTPPAPQLSVQFILAPFGQLNYGASLAISDDKRTMLVGSPDWEFYTGGTVYCFYDLELTGAFPNEETEFLPYNPEPEYLDVGYGVEVLVSSNGTIASVITSYTFSESGVILYTFVKENDVWVKKQRIEDGLSSYEVDGKRLSMNGDGTILAAGLRVVMDGTGTVSMFAYNRSLELWEPTFNLMGTPLAGVSMHNIVPVVNKPGNAVGVFVYDQVDGNEVSKVWVFVRDGENYVQYGDVILPIVDASVVDGVTVFDSRLKISEDSEHLMIGRMNYNGSYELNFIDVYTREVEVWSLMRNISLSSLACFTSILMNDAGTVISVFELLSANDVRIRRWVREGAIWAEGASIHPSLDPEIEITDCPQDSHMAEDQSLFAYSFLGDGILVIRL